MPTPIIAVATAINKLINARFLFISHSPGKLKAAIYSLTLNLSQLRLKIQGTNCLIKNVLQIGLLPHLRNILEATQRGGRERWSSPVESSPEGGDDHGINHETEAGSHKADSFRLPESENFFQPVMKLREKTRVGSKVKKKYDQAKTPYRRVLESSFISREAKEELQGECAELNPVELKKEIIRLQDRLSELTRLKREASTEDRKLKLWSTFLYEATNPFRVLFYMRQQGLRNYHFGLTSRRFSVIFVIRVSFFCYKSIVLQSNEEVGD